MKPMKSNYVALPKPGDPFYKVSFTPVFMMPSFGQNASGAADKLSTFYALYSQSLCKTYSAIYKPSED